MAFPLHVLLKEPVWKKSSSPTKAKGHSSRESYPVPVYPDPARGMGKPIFPFFDQPLVKALPQAFQQQGVENQAVGGSRGALAQDVGPARDPSCGPLGRRTFPGGPSDCPPGPAGLSLPRGSRENFFPL